MTQEEKDIFFMSEALAEAYASAELDEVPVGAVVVFEDTVIACAFHDGIKACPCA